MVVVIEFTFLIFEYDYVERSHVDHDTTEVCTLWRYQSIDYQRKRCESAASRVTRRSANTKPAKAAIRYFAEIASRTMPTQNNAYDRLSPLFDAVEHKDTRAPSFLSSF